MPPDLTKRPVSLAQDHAEMDVLEVKDSDGQVGGENHCHQDQVPLQFENFHQSQIFAVATIINQDNMSFLKEILISLKDSHDS